MNKKSVFFACLIAVSVFLVLTLAAGCARPKPEPKLTPTVVTTGTAPQPSVTVTAAPAQTQAAAPTVVTTKPGAGTPLPTSAPTTAGAAASPTPATASGGETIYTVALGDTLTSLAARFNTTVAAISSLNNISRPDQITAGMKLRIPAGGGAGATTGQGVEYIVQAGDNMGSIAVKFDVTVEAILKANNLSNPDFVYAGQKLIIPKGGGGAPAGDGTPKTHVVKAGETLSSIASKYGVTVKAIMDANNIANSNLIYPGQTLRIP